MYLNLIAFIEQLLKKQDKTWTQLCEHLGSTDVDAIRLQILLYGCKDSIVDKLAIFFNLSITDFY